MKRTVIGSVFLLTGTYITMRILMDAAMFAQSINQWRGSKLWFAIFGASDLGATAQSLNLGLPFTVGLILFTLGVFILITEYFKDLKGKKDRTSEK